MGSRAKGLAKVEVNKCPCFPLVHRASPFITHGIQERFVPGEPALAVPKHRHLGLLEMLSSRICSIAFLG